MPIYDYKCPECDYIEYDKFEITTTSELLVECKNCSTEDHKVFMERIITGTSFILKGDGWAKDGYNSHE